MSLTTNELFRLKFELGFNLLQVGAEPYVQYVAIFDQVIKPYLTAGATATCSTVVPTPLPLPTATTLTLSASGVTVGDTLVVDVDTLAESVTAQSVSGTTVTVLLQKPHTGTYPVVDTTSSVNYSSSTVVPSLRTPPVQVTLALTSVVPGTAGSTFAVNDTLIVDDGTLQESTKIIAVSGNNVTCLLSNGHAGTYNVTVESGESIIRGLLQILQTLSPIGGNVGQIGGNIGGAIDTSGIKKVDEIEFMGTSRQAGNGMSLAGNQSQQTIWWIEYYRDQLAGALGLYRLNKLSGRGGGISVY